MKLSVKIISAIALLGLGSTIMGCYKDNAEDMYPGSSSGNCDTTGVTYSGYVKSVIDAQCATSGCHLGSSATGIDLSTYSGLASIANSGSLISTISHASGFSAMPKGGAKMDDCTIAKIQKWVSDGAPNN